MPGALRSYPLEQFEPSAPPPPPDTPARLLADARAEAEQIRESARADGEAQGRREGREQGLAEAGTAATALDAALAQLQRVTDEHARALERDAVELALTLAAKILAGALDVQPQRVLDVIAGALRRVADRREVAILVNPADLQLVRDALAGVQTDVGGIERCELHAERRVAPGGAVVRTRECEVDATVLTQLERAREVVRAELGEARS